MGGSSEHAYPNASLSLGENYGEMEEDIAEGEAIRLLLARINTRLGEVISGNETIEVGETRNLIDEMRVKIQGFSGDKQRKEKFLESLADMERHFGLNRDIR